MRIKSQKDFFSGLMFMAAGVAFAWGATEYKIGEASSMGPGYFPLMLGVLLALVGAAVLFQSLAIETEHGDRIGAFAWRPLFFVIGANVVFGLMLRGLPELGIPSMGLIVGIYALVFVASLAGDVVKFKEVAIVATILAIGSYLAFVLLLNLQFPVWPWFMTR